MLTHHLKALALAAILALTACASGGYSGPIYSPEDPPEAPKVVRCTDEIQPPDCGPPGANLDEYVLPKVVGAGPEFYKDYSGYDVTKDPLYMQDYSDTVDVYLPAFREMCDRQPELAGGICP